MKHIILLFALLVCPIFAANATFKIEKLSSHRGDVWTIRSLGAITKYKLSHGKIKSNTLKIKWNINKGRLHVSCDGLCNDDDEYLIRMFDKDSLRIDFVAMDIKPNIYISDEQYIVPKSIRKEISYMEIVPIDENGYTKYEIMCDDGYRKSPGDDEYESSSENPLIDQWIKIAVTECIKDTLVDTVSEPDVNNDTVSEPDVNNDTVSEPNVNNDTVYETDANNDTVYEPDGGWYSDKNTKFQPYGSPYYYDLPNNCWGDPMGDYWCN